MYFKQKTRSLSSRNFHSDIRIFILVSLDFLSDTSSFDMSGIFRMECCVFTRGPLTYCTNSRVIKINSSLIIREFVEEPILI